MQNLDKRKALAAKVLGVGKGKIIFDVNRLGEIKEAITKQDIRDMYTDGLIRIREFRGKTKYEPRKNRRGPGKRKYKVFDRKRDYITMVRKLRRYVYELLGQGKLTKEQHEELRKKIKARTFKSKAHLKEHLGEKI